MHNVQRVALSLQKEVYNWVEENRGLINRTQFIQAIVVEKMNKEHKETI